MPKRVDHDPRRMEIAAAAAEAISEQGLERVRLVDVARRAACTTGAVSHYFPDKDAVLGAALEHVLGNLSRSADAQQLAVSLVAALDGLGLRATLEPDEWPAVRLRALLARQILPMLRADRALDPTSLFQPQPEEKSA